MTFSLAVALAVASCSSPDVKAPEPVLPIPEQKQVEWQKWKHTLLSISA